MGRECQTKRAQYNWTDRRGRDNLQRASRCSPLTSRICNVLITWAEIFFVLAWSRHEDMVSSGDHSTERHKFIDIGRHDLQHTTCNYCRRRLCILCCIYCEVECRQADRAQSIRFATAYSGWSDADIRSCTTQSCKCASCIHLHLDHQSDTSSKPPLLILVESNGQELQLPGPSTSLYVPAVQHVKRVGTSKRRLFKLQLPQPHVGAIAHLPPITRSL